MKKKYQRLLGAGFVLLVLALAVGLGLVLSAGDEGGARFKDDLALSGLISELRLNLAVEAALLNEGHHLVKEIFRREGELEPLEFSNQGVDRTLAAIEKKLANDNDEQAAGLVKDLSDLRRRSARADDELRAVIAAWITAMNEGHAEIGEYRARLQIMKNNIEAYLEAADESQWGALPPVSADSAAAPAARRGNAPPQFSGGLDVSAGNGLAGPAIGSVIAVPAEGSRPPKTAAEYRAGLAELKKVNRALDKIQDFYRDQVIDCAKEETDGLAWLLEWAEDTGNSEEIDGLLLSPWQGWLKRFYDKNPQARVDLARAAQSMLNKSRAGLVEYQMALGRRNDLALKSKAAAEELDALFQRRLLIAGPDGAAQNESSYDVLIAGVFLMLLVGLLAGLAAAMIVRAVK